ncbi:MAG TPA: SPOR domain-containing protein [Allosphingosinicella sp.]
MTSSTWIGARFGLALLGAGMLFAAHPAGAQSPPAAWPERPSDALSRNLRLLAQNPKSVGPLMGAGRAALDLGDPQAAITFFARAEEVSPRDGRIKMWIGSALVQLQQPRAAIRFFQEARSLGVAEADVARDRGLAWDIAGDPRQAQRDYRIVLQRGPDAEVTRRLALSLAISGEREPALQLLQPQLAAHDRAAERARAMILALTGDAAGANQAVQAAMPPAQAAAMAPFLARLPTLAAGDRALAVHLGQFPGDGRTPNAPPQSYASVDPALRAGAPDPAQQLFVRRSTPTPTASSPPPAAAPARSQPTPTLFAPVAEERSHPAARQTPRPRTDRSESAWSWSRGTPTRPRARTPEKQPAASAAQQPQAQPSQPAEQAPRPTAEPRQVASAQPKAVPPALQPEPAPAAQAGSSSLTAAPNSSAAASLPSLQPSQQEVAASPGFASLQPSPTTTAAMPQPVTQQPATQAAPPPVPESSPAATPTPEAEGGGISALAQTVANLPQVEAPAARAPEPEPARRPAAKAERPKPAPAKAETPAKVDPKKADPKKADAKKPDAKKPDSKKPDPKKADPKKADPAKGEPSRFWVQVAGGADKGALPREYARLKAKAPKLFAARTAWTTPLKATNRLLVGPFKSDDEAQEFVNQLSRADLTGFAWKSEAGQKIEKLPAK